MTIVDPRSFTTLSLLGLHIAIVGCKPGENAYVPPPPPEVTVAQPAQRSITPFLQENGTIEAVDEAEVRARVRGFVEVIKFEPGQEVSEGDILYQIERDQYQAAVNSAKAAVAAAEASIGVANAMVTTAQAEIVRTEQNRGREQALLERNAGSVADLDAAVAENESAKAALDSAKANVEAAIAEKERMVASLDQNQLDLDYTDVRSPITGRISITAVKIGNLVENGGKLAAVVNRDQVYANFSVSDRAMLRFMRERREELKPGEEMKEADWSKIPVYLRRESDEGFPIEGVLNYVDQEGVDQSTGTLGLRAKIANPDFRLYPGLFVTVRMPLGEPENAILIPEYAILRDQRGLYVLMVNAQNKVERTTVSVSQTISGWAVIDSGLNVDSRVVIDGLQLARPGLEVTATVKELEVDDEMLLRGSTLSGRPTSPATESPATESPAPNRKQRNRKQRSQRRTDTCR